MKYICVLSKHIFFLCQFPSPAVNKKQKQSLTENHSLSGKPLGCMEQHLISFFKSVWVWKRERRKPLITKTIEGRAGEELGGTPRPGSCAEKDLAQAGCQGEH